MSSTKPGFWAILPATVRYDSELSSTAKLLYAEISALQEAKGYCFAQNSYFSEVFGISERTIQRLLRQLEAAGYIRVQAVRDPAGTDKLMRIMWTAAGPTEAADDDKEQKATEEEKGATEEALDESENRGDKNVTHDKNVVGRGDKNVTHNNTSINNTSNTPLKPPKGGRRAKSTPEHKPERFERFWEYYRTHARGENRQGAIRAWDRLKPTDELIDTMAAALARQIKSEDWKKGVGIPHAATWLNNARWEDDVGAEPAKQTDTRGGLDAW